jgi:hypothetical protein
MPRCGISEFWGSVSFFVVKTRIGNSFQKQISEATKWTRCFYRPEISRAWAETMINLEARKLVNTANTVAAMHLSRMVLSEIQFVDEIRAFIMAQFEAARRAKTDDDCMGSSQKTESMVTPVLQHRF